MVKSVRKTGLGRGLDSLLGESRGETSVAPAAETNASVTPAASADTAAANSVQPATNNSVTTTADTRASEAASQIDENSNVTNNLQSSVQGSTHTDPAESKPKPYVEEDDHVEIREVVERSVKAADEVPLAQIVPNPNQPRTQFKAEEIEELANSIKKEGLLQPILVRRVDDHYQIIAGERRWQACNKLGLDNVAVRIADVDDEKAVELALIENIQREDLNPIEEAYGYRRLMETRGMTQSDVAEVVSKGRSTIANALRLLELPDDAQQLLYDEKISAGHARAILSVPTAEGRQKLTERLTQEKLSVRETENLARALANPTAEKEERPREPVPAAFRKVAQSLKEKLQTNVHVKSSRGKNKIEIEFTDEADLRRLFQQLAGE